jgi:hypothetical protein
MHLPDSFRRIALALLFIIGYSGAAVATDPAVLKAQLEALPGVVHVTQGSSPIADTLFFRIDFSQPVDHANPAGPSFNQRATLLHRDESLPMVLVTEGYGTPSTVRQSELAYYLQANQLRVEHRFFVPSTPDPKDWSKLDIAQAAADHHAITQAFKTIYAAKWVATGASKSGMASIYFRYFYPDDVAATVPYVAPSSKGAYDARYVQFLSRVGPADCRAKLRSFQELALSRRSSLLDLIPDYGYGYLGKDRALEFMILELPFAFWQYQSVSLCPAIPVAGASDGELLNFIDYLVGLSFYGDDTLDYYSPYFYQSATQLGGPRYDDRGLAGLLYPRQDIPANYPPYVTKVFDPGVMPDIEEWMRTMGQQVLLIYGENDPWSSGAFEVRTRNDAYRIYVRGEGGNHGASIARMTANDRDFALAKLQEWLGLSPFAKQAIAPARARDLHGIDEPTREELFLH